MTEKGFHPQVKQLLDGELNAEELPPELRREGESALRLLAADRPAARAAARASRRGVRMVRDRAPGTSRSVGRGWMEPRELGWRIRRGCVTGARRSRRASSCGFRAPNRPTFRRPRR